MNKLILILIVVIAIGAYLHFSAPAEQAQAIKQHLPSPENPDPKSFAAMKKQAEDLAKQANARQEEQMQRMEALENQ